MTTTSMSSQPRPVDELDLAFLDFADTNGPEERRAQLDAAQSEHWLARTPMGYLVTRYEECVAVLGDRRFHSAASRIVELGGVDDPDFSTRRRTSILSAEGEEHARLRRLVAPAFTRKAADRLRPYMREVIERLLAPVATRGHVELVAEVCEPYPIPIICRLLGAPEEDWQLFSRWATDLLRIFNMNLVEDLPLIVAAQEEMGAYVRELIARRRTEPLDDLLTDLIAAEEAGDRLSTEELETMAIAVLVGGTDTTRNQLACSMALFAQHPVQWARLVATPELAAQAVDETMRVLGAVRGTMRFATEDVELRGVLFPKDTLVFPSFVAANTDELVFTEPEVFDITRDTSGPPHLTFGMGVHRCLGMWLARAELQEALPLLARVMPDVALDGDIAWKPDASGIWGPDRIPLRFTPVG
ncbi:MAG: cytochrome P450 [Actinobacteria bacterium]|nr:cytochrome P450 [Actinomycetota bacterium]